MSGRIEISRRGAVQLWRFVNPPEGFMDDGTEAALTAALAALEDDGETRAVVLAGPERAEDPVFIRHYDVRLLEARARTMAERGMTFGEDRPVPEPPLHRALRAIERHRLPFLAAIDGACMGGGFELALACDLRLAGPEATAIGLPEARIGLLPGAGGTQRLPRLIGEAKALDFMLFGRTVAAAEAAALGLVHAAPEGPALAEALARAETLAALPAAALAHIKRLVRGHGGDAAGHAAERTLFCDLMVSDEGLARMARMNAEGRDIRDG
ncbi:MAG: enoyl-CoA hydratase/isomerase family protein [Pseudomonadota bacterium]